jgi:hypothetical protein
MAPAAPMSTAASVADAIDAKARLTIGNVTAAFPAARQREAVTWLSGYLARVHGDPAWLCSESRRLEDNPTITAATAPFARRLSRAAHYLLILSARFTSEGSDRHACANSHLAAPGVVVGPQTMTTRAGHDRLTVTYLGLFAYRVVDNAGRDEPMNGSFGATYDVVPHGASWRLSGTEGRNFVFIYSGWPLSLPLPYNYRGVIANPPTAVNDPEALSTVRAAIGATARAEAVRWRVTDHTVNVRTGRSHDVRSNVVASLAGGFGQSQSGDERFFRGGLDDLNRLSGREYAVPGSTIPPHPSWYDYRPADIADSPTYAYESEPYDSSPFAWLSLLRFAHSAARNRCAAALLASNCFAVTVDATRAAYSRTAGTDLGWEFVLGGEQTPTITVGISAGRIAGLVRGEFPVTVFGMPYQQTELVAVADYTGSTPSRPVHPPASSIADLGAFEP